MGLKETPCIWLQVRVASTWFKSCCFIVGKWHNVSLTSVFLRVWRRPGGGHLWWHFRSLQEASGYFAAGKSRPRPRPCPRPLLSNRSVLSLLRRTGRRGSSKETSRVMLRWVACLLMVSKYFWFSPSMVSLSLCLRVWLSHVFEDMVLILAFEACLCMCALKGRVVVCTAFLLCCYDAF